MGNLEGRARVAEWLRARLAELKWDQARLADESHILKSSINKLWLQKQDLTIEVADKLAAVPELKVTREDLIDLFLGSLQATKHQARKRRVAMASFDRLSDKAQSTAINLLAALEKGERRSGD